MSEAARPFTYPIEVRYQECDMQGHVFNGNYLGWLDMAHGALIGQTIGLTHDERIATGVDWVVAECGLRFLAPAHYGDELLIEVMLEPPTRSSLTSHFTISCEGRAITSAFLRHVAVDATTFQKREWPETMRAALENIAVAPDGISTV